MKWLMQMEKINENDYNPDIISLSDENGNEYTFEVLDAVETDTGRYVAMIPVYDDPEKMLDDSGELVVLKEIYEDGENYFEEIEDDAEYETIAEMFIDRLSDMFEIDEE